MKNKTILTSEELANTTGTNDTEEQVKILVGRGLYAVYKSPGLVEVATSDVDRLLAVSDYHQMHLNLSQPE